MADSELSTFSQGGDTRTHQQILLEQFQALEEAKELAQYYEQIRSGEISPEQFVERITKERREFRGQIRALQEKSDYDPKLPDILTMKSFFERGERIVRQQVRDQQEGLISDVALAVLFLDLDGFKEVNDHNDHSVGDQIILTFSQYILSCAGRPNDLVARRGGDEFAVLLSGTNKDNAVVVANRIVETVRAGFRRDFPQVNWKKDVSIGIQYIPTQAELLQAGVSLEQQAALFSDEGQRLTLLRGLEVDADQAMIAAKSIPTSQIVVATFTDETFEEPSSSPSGISYRQFHFKPQPKTR